MQNIIQKILFVLSSSYECYTRFVRVVTFFALRKNRPKVFRHNFDLFHFIVGGSKGGLGIQGPTFRLKKKVNFILKKVNFWGKLGIKGGQPIVKTFSKFYFHHFSVTCRYILCSLYRYGTQVPQLLIQGQVLSKEFSFFLISVPHRRRKRKHRQQVL